MSGRFPGESELDELSDCPRPWCISIPPSGPKSRASGREPVDSGGQPPRDPTVTPTSNSPMNRLRGRGSVRIRRVIPGSSFPVKNIDSSNKTFGLARRSHFLLLLLLLFCCSCFFVLSGMPWFSALNRWLPVAAAGAAADDQAAANSPVEPDPDADQPAPAAAGSSQFRMMAVAFARQVRSRVAPFLTRTPFRRSTWRSRSACPTS